MAKICVRQSPCIFAITIFVLSALSIGLLVFVFKDKLYHKSSLLYKNGHAKELFADCPPNLQTEPKTLVTRSISVEKEVGVETAGSKSETNPWEDFRLPKYIIPLHYDLLIHPNIQNDTFCGSVNITVNVTRNTKAFVVHADRIIVKDAKVFECRSSSDIGVERTFFYNPNQYFVVETVNAVEPGIYKLSYKFFGSLVGSTLGLYKNTYRDGNNQTRYLATSKFQPTYARRVFPCCDEPSFKSTFTVSLVHEPGHIALSNMPVEKTTSYADTDLLATKFHISVPMNTYLVCFVVCDFDYVQTTTSKDKELRVYSAHDKINQTDYALKFARKVLEHFEDYFGIDYPLPKLDMVAIPNFISNGIEHWGIITFEETCLLYDKENPSLQNKEKISMTISQEMAHTWFGGLVTMEWWDDLWLSEGFTSYFKLMGVQEQYPEWDTISQCITRNVQPVMKLDSAMSSRPIVQPVNHHYEIQLLFDNIVYMKGPSILRMLEFFVGKENFRRGISNFLKKYQFKNARTADVWDELSETCGYQGNRSIASIMRTWTEQMGFPFVTVRRVRSDQISSVFVAKQRRFLKNEDFYNESMSSQYLWSIPLSYVTSNGKTDIIWIHNEKEKEFMVPASTTDWVKFNVNQTGYYLVNYEQEEWERMTELLMTNHELLSPADRSNLLFDTFLLSGAGHIPVEVFLSMSKYLKNEAHLIPWETASHSFKFFFELLENMEIGSLFKNYVNYLTNTLYKKIAWKTPDSNLDETHIIELACESGNKECLSGATELFQNWTLGQEIPSHLRNLVYRYGMSEIGQEEHWDFMWNKYTAEHANPERNLFLYGLAHVRVPTLIHRYIEYAMDDQKVGRYDFFTILHHIAGNAVGRPIVWKFLREKWTALVKRFSLNDWSLGNIVKRICSYFTSEREMQEMISFFTKHPEAGVGEGRRQEALENVRNNIKWLKTHKQAVKTWLEKESSAPWYHHRLPSYIIPEHYDLLFHPLLDGDIFTGTADITVSLTKPSDCFLVHAVELNVTNHQITFLKDGSAVDTDEIFTYDDNDYLVLKINRKLPLGRYKLHFEFQGPFKGSLKGLYKSTYVNPDTKERRSLAVTQFSAIDARRAFPCFDEPSFKSTFSVRIRHDSDHFALSNAEVNDIVHLESGLIETRFEKTFPMVTYVLCIVVCDFQYKETTTDKGVKLRVYSTPHQIDKVTYALDAGRKILDGYEMYFDVPFPLKKLDMIALPDLRFSAMENWGLITYIEKKLLVKNESAVSWKHGVASTIAHELAHMWFGNLVTMNRWDDVWLNEGFATYIALKGTKYADPQFNTWFGNLVTMNWWGDLWLKEGFAVYMALKGKKYADPEFDAENDLFTMTLTSAMKSDQTANSHPIVQQVINVKAAILFDTITYSKGGSVLGMLEEYMGEDFRRGVSAYLKKYAFGCTRTEDLWHELSIASSQGLNVALIMDTWTKQMNYPYLVLSKDDKENGAYTIQQRRFLQDPSTANYSADVSPFNYVWQIPITYHTSGSKEVQRILLNSSDTVTLKVPDAKWVKFNVNFTGYYSVNYDVRDWEVFLDVLIRDHQELSISDRVNLVFDSFSLAATGNLRYDIPLNMTRYLKKETNYGAWKTALQNLERIKRYFSSDSIVEDIIKEHIRSLTNDLYRKYTWMNSTGNYFERITKQEIIEAACNNDHYECLVAAKKLFNHWRQGTELDPETRYLVFIYGLHAVDDETSWEFVWQQYLDEIDPDKKYDLQKALILVKNVTQIERFVEAAKNRSFVKKHEYFLALSNIAENQIGLSVVTSLILNDWTDLVKTYGSEATEKFAYSVFKYYDSEEDLKKVREFYRKNTVSKDGQIYRTLAIESILNNIRWREMHKQSVKEWFENNVFMPWKNIRLPRHIIPSKYNITLFPNINKAVFDGSEEVVVTITEPTNYILLHEIGLTIFHTELIRLETGENIPIDMVFPYERNNFHVILFEKMIPEGEYVTKLKFSGVLETTNTSERYFTRDDPAGMVRYSYTDKEDNSTSYFIATLFEATHAREAFPCFDEPDMKATFKLILIHEDNYTAISNMPVENQIRLTDHTLQTEFQESVKMSSYLLCCVIGDFDYLERDYKGKKVRAYAQKHRIEDAEHGLNITVKFLEKFEEYFDVPYVLPKLDSVAIPAYNVRGMEHWGLILYRDRSFLFDSKDSPEERMSRVDRIIAHELAHQWFGNLVTMKWWSDLWLNEGFSTFIMYVPLREDYSTADQFEVRKVSDLMCKDSYPDSHPIVINITNSQDIMTLVDTISYNKGSAVLKMLEYTLKDDFRKGLSNYLKKYAFKNAETKDLWEELSNVSSMDLNITEVMDTWTLQMGYPYVELRRNGETLTAIQRWFLREKNDTAAALLAQEDKSSPYGYIWKIPLIYKNLATGTEHTLWLNERNATFKINAMKDDILKFNPNFVGYYIVKYDEDDYKKFAKRLLEDHTVFSLIDRYSLLHDAFVLARSDRLAYDISLELTKYLKNEKELMPWTILREVFVHFMKMMDGNSETMILLKKYIRLLTQDLYDELVKDKNDSSHFGMWYRSDPCFFEHRNMDLISTIVDMACESQNEKCLESLNSELQLWIQGEEYTANKYVLLKYAIPYSGNSTLWNVLYEKLSNPNATEDDKTESSFGLASFAGTTEIMKTIDMVMQDPLVDSSSARETFESLGNNPLATPVLWHYATRNWENILLRFDLQTPASIKNLFCGTFDSFRDSREFNRFQKVLPQVHNKRVYDCLPRIQKAISWSEKYEQTIQEWLRRNVP